MNDSNCVIMEGVRDYAEHIPVELVWAASNQRFIISASNECGYNGTSVDLLDVINWVYHNRPDILRLPECALHRVLDLDDYEL